jgi:hypothetical protein
MTLKGKLALRNISPLPLTGLVAALALSLVFLTACGAAQTAAPHPVDAAAAPPAAPVAGLTKQAEAQYMAAMGPALADRVRSQPWFGGMGEPQLKLVSAIRKSELAAKRKGEATSVEKMLEFASEQGWYADGLDERETAALTGLFEAYAESNDNPNAPPIGPMLGATIRDGTFDVLQLSETGNMVVLVSATDARLGRKALAVASEALPKVEKIVGAYPYHFLYIEVTRDLPKDILGVSYDQFIGLDEKHVDVPTVTHELTHSTVYGIYPTWFEEGFAHFLEFYLTNTLDVGTREYSVWLARSGYDAKLDLRRRGSTFDDVDRARGFLFMKAIYDIRGIDGISESVRSMRKKTLTDQELIRGLAQSGPPEDQKRVGQLVCDRVVGTTHNYCVGP